MSNPIIIDGDLIYFSLRLTKPNGLPTWIDEETLFTPNGFLVPINAESMNILTLLEGGFPEAVSATGRALIISHVGVIHEVNLLQTGKNDVKKASTDMDGEADYTTQSAMVRVPHGGKVRYVRDVVGVNEMIASAIIDNTPRDKPLDFKKIVSACEKQTQTRLNGYVGHKITKLIGLLNARFPRNLEADITSVVRNLLRKDRAKGEEPLKSETDNPAG